VKLKVTTLAGSGAVSDSVSRSITILSSPMAGFTADPVCAGQPVLFSDTSDANGALMLFYRWDFADPMRTDDSSVIKNPDWPYTAPGTYHPRLILTNQSGCRDTATLSLDIFGLPQAAFNHSLACLGNQTFFFDHSSPVVAPLDRWGWRVSDSLALNLIGTMQGATPGFTFDSLGTYSVMLSVRDTNRCADTTAAFVRVQPSPLSTFSYLQNVENIQGDVQFTNGSIGAVEYHWDFGNGETSTDLSPKVNFAEDGTYTISLVTLNELGCADTSNMLFTMLYKGLWVPNAFAPGGMQQATRLWKPAGVNLASYKCEVFNSFGALLWKSTLLDETGAPVEAWDGAYKNSPCQQDVYIWKIQATFKDGTIWNNNDTGNHEALTKPVWGTITLIR
jgi:PKD repeat protein